MSGSLTEHDLVVVKKALVMQAEFMSQYASPEGRAEWEAEFAQNTRELHAALNAGLSPEALSRDQLYVARGAVKGIRMMYEHLNGTQLKALAHRGAPSTTDFQNTESHLEGALSTGGEK